jgi:hypothetical protein
VTRLQVAPGDGLLVRVAHAALFLPATVAADHAATDHAAADQLVAAFAGSADGAAIDAVTTLADERELDVPPFVVVEWATVLRLAVFGPVEVTSDHRSLARLSGAGSSTWVERTVRSGHVRLEVTADGLHPATDLRLGTVAAGGFGLSLALDESPGTPLHHEPGVARHASPAPGPASADRARRVADALLGGATGSADPPPTFAIGTFDAPAGRDDPTIDVPAGFTDGYRPATQPIDEPITEPVAVPMADPAVPGRWTLRFADGPVEPVDCTLVVGRRPTEGDAGPKPVRLVQIDCPEMSARHLAVWADAVGLWVTDLNSRNRSWVVTSGDHRLVALEPNVATRLEHGTPVQIGTKVFVVERS